MLFSEEKTFLFGFRTILLPNFQLLESKPFFYCIFVKILLRETSADVYSKYGFVGAEPPATPSVGAVAVGGGMAALSGASERTIAAARIMGFFYDALLGRLRAYQTKKASSSHFRFQ